MHTSNKKLPGFQIRGKIHKGGGENKRNRIGKNTDSRISRQGKRYNSHYKYAPMLKTIKEKHEHDKERSGRHGNRNYSK